MRPLFQIFFVTLLVGAVGACGDNSSGSKTPVSSPLAVASAPARKLTGIIIVSKDTTSIFGFLPMDQSGLVVEKGQLVFFRSDVKSKWGEGKAGKVYSMDQEKKLQEVGMFDLNKSDEELGTEYGISKPDWIQRQGARDRLFKDPNGYYSLFAV